MKSQLIEEKQNGLTRLQGLSEQLHNIGQENIDLKTKIEYMNHELMSKNQQLKKGEVEQTQLV